MNLFSDEEQERLLQHLFGVGPSKPIGYLPLVTLRSCQRHPVEVATCLLSRGLFAHEERHGIVGSGALYAAHLPSLSHLLESAKGLCMGSGWPSDAVSFVRRISREYVSEQDSPELFELIAKTFGRTV